MSDLVKLAALWTGTANNGEKMMSGNLQRAITRDEAIRLVDLLLSGDARLLVLKNNNRRDGKKDPNAFLFVAPKTRGGE
jgi:hypothetical protein